jgi:hypothetical protein
MQGQCKKFYTINVLQPIMYATLEVVKVKVSIDLTVDGCD